MSKSRLARTSALAAHTPERYALDVERASVLLAACRDIPAARDLRDKAKAAAVYMRAKKAGLDAQNDAREIMLRAERRMLALLPTADERSKGGRPKKNRGESPPVFTKTALSELGIDKEDAKRLRQHANVSDAVFEEHVQAQRDAGEKLVLAKVAPPPSSKVKGYDGDESYTPSEWIEAARLMMGHIGVDPFSCAVAQKRVKASKYYTKSDSGLAKTWDGRVWFQPPYSTGLIDRAVVKLLDELRSGRTTQAIALLNNATETGWFQSLFRSCDAICFPHRRINFDQPDPTSPTGYKGTKSNRYAQVILGFGVDVDRFKEHFSPHGVAFGGPGEPIQPATDTLVTAFEAAT